jgi:hypothetical protein
MPPPRGSFFPVRNRQSADDGCPPLPTFEDWRLRLIA